MSLFGAAEAAYGGKSESAVDDTSAFSLQELQDYAQAKGVTVDSLALTAAQMKELGELRQNISDDTSERYNQIGYANAAAQNEVRKQLGQGLGEEQSSVEEEEKSDSVEPEAAAEAVLNSAGIDIATELGEAREDVRSLDHIVNDIVDSKQQRGFIATILEGDIDQRASIGPEYIADRRLDIVRAVTDDVLRNDFLNMIRELNGEKKSEVYQKELEALRINMNAYAHAHALAERGEVLASETAEKQSLFGADLLDQFESDMFKDDTTRDAA